MELQLPANGNPNPDYGAVDADIPAAEMTVVNGYTPDGLNKVSFLHFLHSSVRLIREY